MSGKTPTPHIKIGWGAARDIAELEDEFEKGLEVGCVSFGTISADGNRVEIDEVVANYSGDGRERDRTTIQIEQHIGRDRDGHRLVADLHTHPVTEAIRASPADMKHWRNASKTLGHQWGGLILSPSEIWDGGFPACDWAHPQIRGWVSTRGELWAATVTWQPEWLYELDRSIIRREEGTNAT